MLKKVARIPIVLAVVGAYLNTAQLMSGFQPDGSGWVAWLGAASIGIGLWVTIEMLLRKYHPVLLLGIGFFGLSELAGQVLHAALVRGDVVVMTPLMVWVMGYYAPASIVFSGIVSALMIHFYKEDVPGEDGLSVAVAALGASAVQLSDSAREIRGLLPASVPAPVLLSDVMEAVKAAQDRGLDVATLAIDPSKRVLTSVNGRPAPVRVGGGDE